MCHLFLNKTFIVILGLSSLFSKTTFNVCFTSDSLLYFLVTCYVLVLLLSSLGRNTNNPSQSPSIILLELIVNVYEFGQQIIWRIARGRYFSKPGKLKIIVGTLIFRYITLLHLVSKVSTSLYPNLKRNETYTIW